MYSAFHRWVADFDNWLEHARAAQEPQPTGISSIVEPLSSSWISEATGIETRLQSFLHTLSDCGVGPGNQVTDGSAIAFTLEHLRSLVGIMKTALRESQMLYTTIMSSQKDWIDKAVSNMLESAQAKHMRRARAWD
jgi:hypothetical protein